MRTLLVFAALTSSGTCALAAEPAGGAGELDESLADDVVVTATRTASSAFETPVSISRIDGEDFAGIGAKHQADLLNQVPGAYVQRGSGAESLVAIRSPVLSGAGACGAFLVAEDSLPIRPVGFCNLNEMFELNYEQARAIEVLRGPGSAMFGASAVHGIVNVITPRVAELPDLFLSAETGADSFKRVGFGTRIASDFGIYGLATRAPGWRQHSGVDELKLNLRTDQDLGAGMLTVRAAGTVLNQETAGFIQGFEAYRDRGLARSNPNPEAFRDASSARVSAHYSTDSPHDDGDYYEIGALYRRSRMDFSQHFLIGKPVEHNAQTSYLASGAMYFHRGDWRARIAVDAETAATELTEFQPGPATDGAPAANAIRPARFHYDYTVHSDTVGATLSVDYEFASHWRATAALRADTTNYDYDNRMLDGNTDQHGTPCGPAGCLYARPADRNDRFDNLSPRLTVGREAGLTHVYLTASTGYRPPEMTELYRLQRQQTLADLESEQLESVELGWKRRGFIDWELALFAMEKRHLILRESNGFNVGNGSTRHRGLEYRIGCGECGPARHAVAVTLAGTLARHTYAFSRAVEGGESIRSGNDIDTAPRNLHSLDLAYPAGEYVDDWQVGATWNYVGSYFLDAANSARYPGHQAVDLRLRWRPSQRTALTLRVDNVFDRAYADRADFAFGNYRYFPARGRAAFLTIDFKSD
jgi:outer membrane receptor protein involved in Fe transport